MRPGERLSLTVTLPNEQRIEVLEAVVRWSRHQEFGVETVEASKHTEARLIHYVRRLVHESVEILHE
jgi:acetolactate synthase regulatory subunit